MYMYIIYDMYMYFGNDIIKINFLIMVKLRGFFFGGGGGREKRD